MTSAFQTPLDFRDLNAGRRCGIRLVLLAPLVYDSALLGRTITVRAGFLTDLASIPQPLWNILPPIGAYDEAAVVHDFLFQYPGTVTLHQANAVLNEAMAVCDTAPWKRRAIYAGVELGGWAPWNRYRRGEHPTPSGDLC